MKNGQRLLMVALLAGVLALMLALLARGGQAALAVGSIIYVDADATGANNGSTWVNAFTDLQDALDEAEPLNQIWVAAGTYKPTWRFLPGDDPRLATFQMVNGVAIYGGFDPEAGAVKFEDRDWVANETILSGNIGDADRSDDNSYHVLYHPEGLALDGSAILDGFTITAGNANGLDYPGGVCGGGVYNEGSSPALNNITLVDNSAVYGGALFITNGEPDGEDSELTLTNATFTGNSAVEGGAVYIDAAQADPGDWELIFANCIFWDNLAERGGGVAITWGEPDADTPLIRFTNCTFNSNEAELGGGMYVGKAMGPGEGWLELTNSILWGDAPDEIYVEDGAGLPLVTYSDVQGGYEGDNNIDQEPDFVAPDAGDLHLQPDSPCIDAGDNDAPDLTSYDIDGNPRILDGDGDGLAVVDMGAVEFEISPNWLGVEIDVTPSVPSNVIKLSSPRRVPVAILGTDDFDASQVAPDTVVFAGATHVGFSIVDVDQDGHDDVLLDFRARDMVDLDEDSTEATLTGETLGGVPIEGTDEVKVIP